MNKTLTDTELEMMKILWQLKSGSVHDVLNALPADRKLAYTSVSTMLRILEQKKILKSEKEGRGHVYIPKVSKSEYEAFSVEQMVHTIFDGTPTNLVKHLLENENLTQDELARIRKLIEEKSK